VFRAVGIDTLDAYTDVDASLRDRLYNRLLALSPLPDDERCLSATCRRVSFMYSQLYEHSQLTEATHQTLHELFGIANLAASEHALRMVRAGHIVDREGRDVYLQHVERLALPLLMIHGEQNACFEIAGSAASLDWLQHHNDPGLYSRVVIPEFGHLDCIFGARAVEVVYPHILEHLEDTA
jgi:cholesterol oxidase